MPADFDQLKQAVVDAVQAAGRASTASEVKVGRAANKALWSRLGSVAPDRRRESRAATMLELASAAGTTSSNLNRSIRTHGVLLALGDQVKVLSLPAVRALTPLIRPNGSTWGARPKHQAAAVELVTRAAQESQSGSWVAERVRRILGRQPRAKKDPPTVQERVARLVAKLTRGELSALHRAIGLKLREPAPSIDIPPPSDVQSAKRAA